MNESKGWEVKIVKMETKGVLSNLDIVKERNNGNVIIEPFNDHQLSNCSYDVTLGPYYYNPTYNVGLVNPFSKKHVCSYWGKVQEAKVIDDPEEAEMYDVKVGTKIISIRPNETILAHTNEFIGGKKFITSMMKSRSSMGRANIAVCKCSGWGDIGFFNSYTMEITNFSNAKIILPVNCRIAQIVFLYTGLTDKPYKSKYQQSDDIEEIMRTWNPEMMLPRGYMD